MWFRNLKIYWTLFARFNVIYGAAYFVLRVYVYIEWMDVVVVATLACWKLLLDPKRHIRLKKKLIVYKYVAYISFCGACKTSTITKVEWLRKNRKKEYLTSSAAQKTRPFKPISHFWLLISRFRFMSFASLSNASTKCVKVSQKTEKKR